MRELVMRELMHVPFSATGYLLCIPLLQQA